MPTLLRAVALVAIVLAFPATALAKTHALQPFPTNLDTVADATQVTGLRVDLPTPNCASFPSDCADIAVLNTLDGFNIQPRITIPFSSAIDTRSVSGQTIFLIGPGHHVVGINQAVWEPFTNTLHVESDQQLAEATTYLLVVTRDVRDTKGRQLNKFNFGVRNGDDGDDDEQGDEDTSAAHSYRDALRNALKAERIDRDDVAAASLFTTQSITAISTKIRSQLQATPVSFVDGGIRDVFPLATVAGIDWNQQTKTTGPLVTAHVPTPALVGVGTVPSERTPHPTTRTPTRSSPPSAASRARRPSSRSTTCSSPCSCRWVRRPRAAGPSRSSATGSRTPRTARPSPSPAPSPATGSRPSRSTSSVTASAQRARTRSCETAAPHR